MGSLAEWTPGGKSGSGATGTTSAARSAGRLPRDGDGEPVVPVGGCAPLKADGDIGIDGAEHMVRQHHSEILNRAPSVSSLSPAAANLGDSGVPVSVLGADFQNGATVA